KYRTHGSETIATLVPIWRANPSLKLLTKKSRPRRTANSSSNGWGAPSPQPTPATALQSRPSDQVVAALALTRPTASLLDSVKTTDPGGVATASATRAITVLAARWTPARKPLPSDPNPRRGHDKIE